MSVCAVLCDLRLVDSMLGYVYDSFLKLISIVGLPLGQDFQFLSI